MTFRVVAQIRKQPGVCSWSCAKYDRARVLFNAVVIQPEVARAFIVISM